MTLQIYNTLTNRVEAFEPLNPPNVTFYTCGPTVYDFAHIGNFRSFLNADLLRRTLEFLGYRVKHVMNITDVGHMTDDDIADGAGEDKMEVAARRILEAKKSGKLPPEAGDIDPSDPYAIAAYYADAFLEDARRLGLKVAIEEQQHPELMPRPTQYINAMIELVETLIRKGHAYQADDGVVYFDVQSFDRYGKLSGNTPDQIRSGQGGRVSAETQAVKKHPADFMLWKPDPKHLMRWDSPWGEGYPGWHLECSVMALRLLAGETDGVIDLHSGGEDNIFPHHECEIAQSCAASGHNRFARYWFHTRHLMVEGEKMSKSKGNFYTLRDLFSRGAAPAAVRLELIKTHYRANANFTFQGLKDSDRMIRRWRALIEKGDRADPSATPAVDLTAVENAFRESIASDLNIAGALGIVNKWVGEASHPTRDDAALMRRFDSVIGVLDLDFEAPQQPAGAGDAAGEVDVERIEQLIVERAEARQSKNFARADAIRDELDAIGIVLTDSPQGTSWSRKMG